MKPASARWWELVLFGNVFAFAIAAGEPGVIRVNPAAVVVDRPHSLVGANIEDLNFQLYGGLYSQLLHGEGFEEHVDPTELLGLEGPQRFAVWVVLDERGRPRLRHFSGRALTRLYDRGAEADWQSSAPRDGAEVQIGRLTFRGGVILPEELPGDLGRRLVALAGGDAQASRHWRKVQTGSARGELRLVREGVFTGRQAQEIRFVDGTGEVGIDNAGLFRAGIPLAGGRPYEGTLRIRSATATDVFVSLRRPDGRRLAETAVRLEARPGEYQRVGFALTPDGSEAHGRLAVTLWRPAAITIDYAFLQAGEWGRFAGLPVRREFAEAMLGLGVQTIRYNGSMVNRCPDGTEHYRWKRMIGPRDERVPYHGFFNPYASHGFSVFEFMDFAAAAGLRSMIGLRIDETERDLADFVEYCHGSADTEWGRRRIAHGHPAPYALDVIQIGNEQAPDEEYLARFKALAAALWSRDPQLLVAASVNARNLTAGNLPPLKAKRQQGGIAIMTELARWVRAQGRERQFILDSHYQSSLDHADTVIRDAIGLVLAERLARAVPGFALRLWPMEENGDRCTWERGLAHAHNLNTLHRLPLQVERAGTANTFQAWDLAQIWDQGRIHFLPGQFVFQPSYHVDRLFADEWLPLVVEAACGDPRLDVLAKRSRDGAVVALYLANLGEAAVRPVLRLEGFAPRTAQLTRIGSAQLDARNSPDAPRRVAPELVPFSWNPASPQIELPGRSFSVLRLER